MKRRHFILMLGGSSAGALSVGTGAFSSAEMQRGVNVSVVDDEDALVRYETPSDEAVVETGEQITLVRIRNQFGGNQQVALVGVEYKDESHILKENTITVERFDGSDDSTDEDAEEVDNDFVTITRGEASEFPEPNETDAIGPGDWLQIVAETDVAPAEEAEIEVTVTVKGIEGTGVSARIFGDTRTFTIKGIDPLETIEGVEFRGKSGRAEIKTTTEQPGRIEARAYYTKSGDDVEDGVYRTGFTNVSVNSGLNAKDFGKDSNDPTIEGIQLEDGGGVYIRPGSGNNLVTETTPEDEAFNGNLNID